MGCTHSTQQQVSGAIDKLKYPVIGDKSIMRKKAHGTSATPVQQSLRWDCSVQVADRICNYNRHFAEPSGKSYFQPLEEFAADTTVFMCANFYLLLFNACAGSAQKNSLFAKEFKAAKKAGTTMKFYDSNTGDLLFEAPKGRSHDDFWRESQQHGWPSFRDKEVNWDVVRCLRNGESVSIHGTHLGHNLPDRSGNRYCINLVSIAGSPSEQAPTAK